MRTRKCKGRDCQAWSWELQAGKPCPYCHKVDRMARFWIWMDRIVIVASLVAIAGLAYLSGAI